MKTYAAVGTPAEILYTFTGPSTHRRLAKTRPRRIWTGRQIRGRRDPSSGRAIHRFIHGVLPPSMHEGKPIAVLDRWPPPHRLGAPPCLLPTGAPQETPLPPQGDPAADPPALAPWHRARRPRGPRRRQRRQEDGRGRLLAAQVFWPPGVAQGGDANIFGVCITNETGFFYFNIHVSGCFHLPRFSLPQIYTDENSPTLPQSALKIIYIANQTITQEQI